ncbi:MAG: ComEC/Rec2 family competence protein [Candidatus Falkowbacteria bacterium]|nr:ComEC/Rec2 family competence protein [Candidatus Falkowbacteria bacterium]
MFKKILNSGGNINLRPAQKISLISLIIIVFIFCLSLETPAAMGQAQNLNNKNTALQGLIISEPESAQANQSFILNTSQGKVLVYANLYPEYSYGDILEGNCVLKVPEAFNGFDYARYLAKDHIYLICYYPSFKKIGFKASFFRNLFHFKSLLTIKINSALPEPEAGLASALILGYKKTLDKTDNDNFSRVGLSHIIAISGSHITIISAIILDFFLLLGLSRRRSFYFSIIFLIFYVVLTGLQASALRSTIMGILVLWAYQSGRLANLLNILLISAAIMLIFQPNLLRADLGFQLSFAAVLGIIYIYPPLNKRLEAWSLKFKTKKYYSSWKNILNTLSLTLACQLATAPILISSFGRLSLIAPLSNILVLWTFPFLMIGLISALFLSFIIPGLNLVWFYPNYLLLKFIFIVVNLLATVPGAAIQLS